MYKFFKSWYNIIAIKGFLIDYLGPLALVVAISLLKELYDDI